jgi:DNA polymerase II large subunit
LKSVTIDLLDRKAYKLLKDLERLNLIRLKDVSNKNLSPYKNIQKLKGSMKKQPKAKLDEALRRIRNEWD